MSLLTLQFDDGESYESEENYLSPKGQLWIIGIDRNSTPFILQEPDIHWSFFENGYGIPDLPLNGIPEDLDSGIYSMKFDFWSVEYAWPDSDHAFDYMSHELIKSYA